MDLYGATIEAYFDKNDHVCPICCDSEKPVKRVHAPYMTRRGQQLGVICVSCLERSLMGSILTQDLTFKCKCHYRCDVTIPDSTLVKLGVPQERVERRARILLEQSLVKDKDIRFCPASHCGAPMVLGREVCQEAKCPECDGSFCTDCNTVGGHPGLTCDELKHREFLGRWTSMVTKDAISEAVQEFVGAKAATIVTDMVWTMKALEKQLASLKADVIALGAGMRCIGCSNWIWKNGGCDHMTCRYCNAEFWFCCGVPYNHGNGCQCNKKPKLDRWRANNASTMKIVSDFLRANLASSYMASLSSADIEITPLKPSQMRPYRKQPAKISCVEIMEDGKWISAEIWGTQKQSLLCYTDALGHAFTHQLNKVTMVPAVKADTVACRLADRGRVAARHMVSDLVVMNVVLLSDISVRKDVPTKAGAKSLRVLMPRVFCPRDALREILGSVQRPSQKSIPLKDVIVNVAKSSTDGLNHGLVEVKAESGAKPNVMFIRHLKDLVKVVVYRRVIDNPKRREKIRQMEIAKSEMKEENKNFWAVQSYSKSTCSCCRGSRRQRFCFDHEPYTAVNQTEQPPELLKPITIQLPLDATETEARQLVAKRLEEENNSHLRLRSYYWLPRENPDKPFKLREQEALKNAWKRSTRSGNLANMLQPINQDVVEFLADYIDVRALVPMAVDLCVVAPSAGKFLSFASKPVVSFIVDVLPQGKVSDTVKFVNDYLRENHGVHLPRGTAAHLVGTAGRTDARLEGVLPLNLDRAAQDRASLHSLGLEWGSRLVFAPRRCIAVAGDLEADEFKGLGWADEFEAKLPSKRGWGGSSRPRKRNRRAKGKPTSNRLLKAKKTSKYPKKSKWDRNAGVHKHRVYDLRVGA